MNKIIINGVINSDSECAIDVVPSAKPRGVYLWSYINKQGFQIAGKVN